MSKNELRTTILKSYTANAAQIEELLDYNKNRFNPASSNYPFRFPLPDELHISAWEDYATEAQNNGLIPILKKRIVQFQFPIRENISKTQQYRNATLKGMLPTSINDNDNQLEFKRPDLVKLILHRSMAGAIPVFIAKEREDFISLVRVFTMRNEPQAVPDSMGACMVAGFNNWDRIRHLQKKWKTEHPDKCSETEWQNELRRIIPQKELYQDRFIILSRGPYSSVPASELGLSEEKWQEISLKIRLEHECSHYFTKRMFSAMNNNLLDEFIADYMGMVKAIGYYRADWFLRFMGLENFPNYRKGARLENYRGKPPLSDKSFQTLQALVKDAAENVGRFSNIYVGKNNDSDTHLIMLLALCQLTLEELASSKAGTFLQEAFHHAAKRLKRHG